MSVGAGLGTFAGVFTPSLLTIIGMVLFLRLGFVVGSVGLMEALLILAVAHAISILTSLSVAAIATNLQVKGGGDYYLISRTLGQGYGGAIGLVLFGAQSLAVGFYCIGFAEVLTTMLGQPSSPVFARVLGCFAVVSLFALAWRGAAGAVKFQYIVMVLLGAALIAFTLGAWQVWDYEVLYKNLPVPAAGIPFWVGFAVFFPAVTGFTQGISMSGDLRDPGRSIPLGTLAAVLISLLVYFGAALLFAGAAPAEQLAVDGMAMQRLSALPFLFEAGVIAATLSSALASLLGAPRILQAMARDEVLPLLRPFARGHGEDANPRRALLLSGAIAILVILGGSLNTVAGLVSMFFLLSYGLLNYATYFEAKAASPSFRPSFKFFNPSTSLLGAVGCAAIMFAINPVWALTAGVIVFAVLQYLRLRAMPARWADGRRSYHLQQVRNHLHSAAGESGHSRDWRPQILVFSEDPLRRAQILKFASWIEGGAGIITAVRVIERQGPAALEQRKAAVQALQAELGALESAAFPLVVVAPRLDEAIAVVVQSAGVGPVQANTVIANWLRDTNAMQTFAARRFNENLSTAFRVGCNLLMLDSDAELWKKLEGVPARKRRVDLWWSDDVTGELLLLLAHLMTRTDDWHEASIRVLAFPKRGSDAPSRRREIEERLDKARIRADAQVLESDENISTLIEASRDASIVFVPFSIHSGRFYHRYGGEIGPLMDQLPITVLGMAADDVDLEADPDHPESATADEQVAAKPGDTTKP